MKKYLLIPILLILISCNNDNIDFTEKQVNNFTEKIDLAQYEIALNIVKQFDVYEKESNKEEVSSRTLNINLSDLKVTNVKETEYVFQTLERTIDETIEYYQTSDVTLRSSKSKKKNENVDPNFKVYTIEFEKNGKNGFAIATGDKRVNDGIYAFVLEGSLADTSFNIGLKQTLYRMKDIYENDLAEYYIEPDEVTTRVASQIYALDVDPLTSLRWSTTSPYNKNLPYCPNAGSNIQSGCVTAACAQVIAYLSPPSIENAYKLETIRDISNFYSSGSGTTYDNLTRFYATMGIATNTTYNCSDQKATSEIKHIRDDLELWGVNYSYTESNINLESLAFNLKAFYPHITSGFSKSPKEGHVWVWEGIRCSYSTIDNSAKKVKITNDRRLMLYCNWGWGGYDNGWYAEFEKPSSKNQAYLAENCQIYITKVNYNYDTSRLLSKVRTYAL